MYREELMKQKKNKVAGLYPICKIELLGLYIILIILANIIQIKSLPILLVPLSFCIPLIFAVSGQIKDFFSFIRGLGFLACFVFDQGKRTSAFVAVGNSSHLSRWFGERDDISV